MHRRSLLVRCGSTAVLVFALSGGSRAGLAAGGTGTVVRIRARPPSARIVKMWTTSTPEGLRELKVSAEAGILIGTDGVGRSSQGISLGSGRLMWRTPECRCIDGTRALCWNGDPDKRQEIRSVVDGRVLSTLELGGKDIFWLFSEQGLNGVAIALSGRRFSYDRLYAIDLTSGKVVWERAGDFEHDRSMAATKLASDAQMGLWRPDWAHFVGWVGGSGGVSYLQHDLSLLTLDSASRRVIAYARGYGNENVSVVSVGGKLLCTGYGGGPASRVSVQCFAADLTPVWKTDLPGSSKRWWNPGSPYPIVTERSLIVTNGEILWRLGPASGRVLWRVSVPAEPVAVDQGVVWAGQGSGIVCLNEATGAVLAKRPVVGNVIGLAAAGGVAYATVQNGTSRGVKNFACRLTLMTPRVAVRRPTQ